MTESTQKSVREGVPEMQFIEDIEAFLEGKKAESIFQQIQEEYYKYKFMEQNFGQRRTNLKNKVPEIGNTLSMIEYLIRKKDDESDTSVNFVLSDNLYTRAKLVKSDRVGVWLGANVMVEYSLEEAQKLMSKTKKDAENALERTENDLSFLKDQITTCEVNLARIYNFMVTVKKSS